MTYERKAINHLINKRINEIEEKIERAYNSGDNTYHLYAVLKAYENLKDDIDEIYYY